MGLKAENCCTVPDITALINSYCRVIKTWSAVISEGCVYVCSCFFLAVDNQVNTGYCVVK